MFAAGRLVRRRWFVPVVAAALLGVVGSAVAGFVIPRRTAAGDTTVRVMTYNLRGAADPPPRDWRSRLPLVVRVIGRDDPDVIGVQEARWAQLRDLERKLPAYGWIGIGAAGGTRGEFSAILYRRDRLDVLDFDDFWLSDTPEVIGSATWGNRYVRVVTWAEFRDRRDGRAFYDVNTHLDDQSANAQVKGAQLILDRVRGLRPGVPVLATGDFNTPAGTSRPYKILTGPDAFEDTWVTARRRGPAYRTYNDWRPPARNGHRIDWILSRGGVRALSAEIDTYRPGDVDPSDHFPVIAAVEVGG